MEIRPPKIVRYIVTYINSENKKSVKVIQTSTPKKVIDVMFNTHNAKDVLKMRLLYNPIIAAINKDNGYTTDEEETESIEYGAD